MNKLIQFYKKNEAILIVVFFAFFLRIYHLWYQSIWVDELHTMIECDPKLTFKESNELILFREGIPRFHFFIVKFFNSIFGHTISNARFISVLFGVLSVILIYKLGKKMFNKNIGLFSAIFLTLNLFLIEYSQEARTYSMLVFFVILSFYYLVTFIQKSTFNNAILLGISLGLTANSHSIGLLNVATIYLVLLYILIITKESKIDLFKKIFVSGLILMLLFIPIIPTITNVLTYKSFWISKPSMPYLFQIFNQLLGNSLIFTGIFIFIYTVFLYKSLRIISKKEDDKKGNFVLGFIIINLWIWLEVTVILLKSYFGISIVLHRYFIAIIPAFILVIAVTIDFIKNELLKRFVLFTLIAYLIVDIFIIKDFYSVKRKSEYDKVANFVIEKNTSKNKIVSSWGWLMSYYYNKNNQLLTEEKVLNAYIDEMRKGQINPISFWFVDGNSNKFELSKENKDFVNKNFILRNRYNGYDAWCIEFKSKHNENQYIEINKFVPSTFDGTGAMIFTENITSKYPKIDLEKGEYVLTIKGFSLPEKPINGVNAHFNIVINNKIAKSISLSTIPNQQSNMVPINHSGGDFNLELVYDNDLVIDNQDRNAVINSISLIRK